MFTIYVGMALNSAPEEFTGAFQNELKGALRAVDGTEVLDFYWKAITSNPADDEDLLVYKWDRERTQSADLCVFIADHASTGMGQEVEIRGHANRKPALGFVKRGVKVSKMFIGGFKFYEYPVYTYDTVQDIVTAVVAWRQSNRVQTTS